MKLCLEWNGMVVGNWNFSKSYFIAHCLISAKKTCYFAQFILFSTLKFSKGCNVFLFLCLCNDVRANIKEATVSLPKPLWSSPPQSNLVKQHLKREGTSASRTPTLPTAHRRVYLSHMSISPVVKISFYFLLPAFRHCFERCCPPLWSMMNRWPFSQVRCLAL